MLRVNFNLNFYSICRFYKSAFCTFCTKGGRGGGGGLQQTEVTNTFVKLPAHFCDVKYDL